MSIFASQTQRTLQLPCDPPHTVTLRKLTGRELERAQAEHATSIATGRGWAQRLNRILAHGQDASVAKELADPLLGYDRSTVVAAGLVGWSYTEKGEDKKEHPKAVTPDAVADLDDEASEFIAREIMRLTKPALFVVSEQELEAQQKNG